MDRSRSLSSCWCVISASLNEKAHLSRFSKIKFLKCFFRSHCICAHIHTRADCLRVRLRNFALLLEAFIFAHFCEHRLKIWHILKNPNPKIPQKKPSKGSLCRECRTRCPWWRTESPTTAPCPASRAPHAGRQFCATHLHSSSPHSSPNCLLKNIN